MATHSSVLAWRIPGMAEPGGLPFMGSHRVGHDWSDLAVAATEFAGLSRWLSGKESACNAWDIGDVGLIPGLGRSPGRGLGNPLQYSCLENSMDTGDWWARVHGSQRVEHDWSNLAHAHRHTDTQTHCLCSHRAVRAWASHSPCLDLFPYWYTGI